ncbi:iron-containing alcohol dehydrogenase [Stenotrophomonas sp. MMGLT7]|uniref:iron-containing alcohol dehydrogenase n=1 Tax=Stenotrophomonas sp. MMGLT7 TaxID=2901227 RepID=UPI001E57AEAF|nr:iron-containing alcohol dehydrogenase [Stenotrophomonas sp. MMGLT7]MCD7097761.1 iron-containing alcohol dehydrogenase [Stenotrophomonas sp. MMGLT7]
MTPFQFHTVPHLVVETGAAARLDAILGEYFQPCRACIVTTPPLPDNGTLEPIIHSLAAAGWSVDVVSDVQSDPPEAVVLDIAARARTLGSELVIGVGGGSAMDVAKLVAVLLGSEQPLPQMYGIDKVRGTRLPLVQIPTTAGTGSEVTPIAVVTTGETTKSGIVARQLYADLVVLDAGLTLGLPPAVTAATGIDAMVHAIESFTSRRLKNPISDSLAIKALKLLDRSLLAACRDGRDLAAREDMLLGALLAGQAFANAPVGAVHALAYPVGGIFHVAHGVSNALVLPHVLRHNCSRAGEAYAQLADAILPPAQARGSIAERAEAFIGHMQRLVEQAAVPTRLRDVGIGRQDIPALAAAAMLQTRLLANNPCDVDLEDATSIYEKAW